MKGLSRKDIARVAAEDIPEGSCVNLGVGLPTMIAEHIPHGREVLLQSEQGLLGLGPAPKAGQEDNDVVNAGKAHVTLLKGASIFSHSDSFLMIRGGHIDIACLGAFQVAQNGDLANWSTGSLTETPGVGQRDGAPRLLERCTYPLTGHQCVSRIYTNLALIEVTVQGFLVQRLADDIDFDTLQNLTGAKLQLSPHRRPYRVQPS